MIVRISWELRCELVQGPNEYQLFTEYFFVLKPYTLSASKVGERVTLSSIKTLVDEGSGTGPTMKGCTYPPMDLGN